MGAVGGLCASDTALETCGIVNFQPASLDSPPWIISSNSLIDPFCLMSRLMLSKYFGSAVVCAICLRRYGVKRIDERSI